MFSVMSKCLSELLCGIMLFNNCHLCHVRQRTCEIEAKIHKHITCPTCFFLIQTLMSNQFINSRLIADSFTQMEVKY